MNVNSDHDEAVVADSLMMGLLVSGLVWLKVKQRTFPNYKHPSYHQGVCLFLGLHKDVSCISKSYLKLL